MSLLAKVSDSRLQLGALPDESRDSISGVRLLQPLSGYRVNLDPILLAHFAGRCTPRRGAVCDLGTGSGIIPLILARKFGRRKITALELQPQLFWRAQRNVQLNRFERSVTLVLGDLRQVEKTIPVASFETVVCNPPFRARSSGRASPDLEKALSTHELAGGIVEVARAAAHLLVERGSFCVIYPASRLVDLQQALGGSGLEPTRMRLVFTREGRPANRVLLEAKKGGSRGLVICPSLLVHARGEQAYTPEVEEMLQARAARFGPLTPNRFA